MQKVGVAALQTQGLGPCQCHSTKAAKLVSKCGFSLCSPRETVPHGHGPWGCGEEDEDRHQESPLEPHVLLQGTGCLPWQTHRSRRHRDAKTEKSRPMSFHLCMKQALRQKSCSAAFSAGLAGWSPPRRGALPRHPAGSGAGEMPFLPFLFFSCSLLGRAREGRQVNRAPYSWSWSKY